MRNCWRATTTPAGWSCGPWTSTRGSPAMSDVVAHDLLASSPDTWRDRSADPPAVPPALDPPPPGTPLAARLRALHARHLLREQRARDVYAASRSPERGWPVAGNDAVFAFVRRLVRQRRSAFVRM